MEYKISDHLRKNVIVLLKSLGKVNIYTPDQFNLEINPLVIQALMNLEKIEDKQEVVSNS